MGRHLRHGRGRNSIRVNAFGDPADPVECVRAHALVVWFRPPLGLVQGAARGQEEHGHVVYLVTLPLPAAAVAVDLSPVLRARMTSLPDRLQRRLSHDLPVDDRTGVEEVTSAVHVLTVAVVELTYAHLLLYEEHGLARDGLELGVGSLEGVGQPRVHGRAYGGTPLVLLRLHRRRVVQLVGHPPITGMTYLGRSDVLLQATGVIVDARSDDAQQGIPDVKSIVHAGNFTMQIGSSIENQYVVLWSTTPSDGSHQPFREHSTHSTQ